MEYTLEQAQALTTDQLFEAIQKALYEGHFGQAYMLADVICVPEKARQGKDLLNSAYTWKSMNKWSLEQLQGLEDRIDQYNVYVSYSQPDPCGNSECSTCLNAGIDPMAQD
jgi:hypothetical protein